MSSRDPFHAPECDCPKCNYADGQDAERAAVVKYLQDFTGSDNHAFNSMVRFIWKTIEKGEHTK